MAFRESSRIRLIVGLGNPGEKYSDTRHNAGFMIIDQLLDELNGPDQYISAYESTIWERKYRGRKLHLQKPLTYMNNSGKAVASFLSKHKIQPEEMLVIFDDLDLPLGKVRIRKNGGSGGHNGIKSIIDHVQSERFNRLRVGIGRQDERRDQVDHVLGRFTAEEIDLWTIVVKTAATAVKEMLFRGVGFGMNTYNGLTIEINEK